LSLIIRRETSTVTKKEAQTEGNIWTEDEVPWGEQIV